MRATARCSSFLVSAIALLMAACGGGGGGAGGGGGGGGAPSTGLTVSTTSVEISADAGVSSNPTATFNITVSNPPAAGVYIGGRFTNNGIEDVTLQASSATDAAITIIFKDPSILGPGVYDDSLQLGICTDSTCQTLQNGTQHTITVKYTVTGTPPPPASVSASTNVVNVQEVPFIPHAPSASVDLIFQRVQPSEVSATTVYTDNGLSNAYVIPDGSGGLHIQMYFKASSALGIGTYDDTVTVTLCKFSACPTGLNGSPVVITTHYTVSSTVAGPNGYTIRQVTASATDVAWDAVSGNIYLSTPSTAPANANSVVALDPVSGGLVSSAFAGSDPSFEAVSDDGQFLYVGFGGSNTVQRLKLPGLTPDITLPMGSYPSGLLFAGEIQVFPGQPHSVVVARSPVGGYPYGYDVAIFDDAVQRPNALHRDDAYIASTQFGATPGVLYGGDGVISTMAIDSSGVSLTGSANFSLGYGVARIHFESGVLYTDRGLAIEPVTSTLLGTYAMAGGEFGEAAVPDSGLNRIFILVFNGFGFFVRSYDLSTYTPIAEVPLTGVAFPYNQPLRIIRWGADGLALPTGDGRVLLITGPFVKP